jgi:hypothetical protein
VRRGWLLPAVGLVLVASTCSNDDGASSSDEAGTVDPGELSVDWPTPVAEDGTALLVGERLTGDVLRVVPGPPVGEPETVTSVDVVAADDDQRGLLGLTVTDDARVFAAYTRADDGRIVVAEIDGSDRRIVWEGPISADRANGGHLVVAPDGRLVIGIGDLLESDLVAETGTPNGKILTLDPDGESGQPPEVLSGGWNNPFAFSYDSSGQLWVADNAGPTSGERVGRGDIADGVRVELWSADDKIAPSALVVIDDTTLGVCGFVTGQMERVDLVAQPDGAGVAPMRSDELVTTRPCSTGATVISGARVASATPTELWVVALDDPGSALPD